MENVIMQLMNKSNDKFENNCFTSGIFIDPSKVFDTVNNQILISKLKNYWVKGKNSSWFKSYLKNRKQYLNYNNDVTYFAQIKCGVPQGTITWKHILGEHIRAVKTMLAKNIGLLYHAKP